MTKNLSPLMVAFITVAVDMLGFGIVVPILPRYAERFQHAVSPALQGLTIGLLMASFSMVQFFFAPVWGKLSDRIGRRPVLLIGLSGSVLAYLLFAFASSVESLTLLFAARIGQGLCGATISTAQAVIADCTPAEERARGMALVGLAFGIGFTFGPVIGALAVGSEEAGLSLGAPGMTPGLVAAGISLAAFLFAFLRMPETNHPGARPAGRRIFDLDGFRYALGNPITALPILTFFVAVLAFGQFEGTLSRLTKDVLGFTDRQNFYTFFYIGVLLMVAQGLIVRKLVRRTGEVAMVVAGIAGMLVGMAGLGIVAVNGSMILGVIALTLTTVGFSSLTGPANALVSRAADPRRQGEVLGVAQSCGAVARIIGPLMGNLVYGGQAAARYHWPYFIAAALLAVALALALRLKAPAAAPDEVVPATVVE